MGIAIKKIGKALKQRMKRYKKAEDSILFYTSGNPASYFDSEPKMDLDSALHYLESGGKRFTMTPNKPKTRIRRKKGRGSLPIKKS